MKKLVLALCVTSLLLNGFSASNPIEMMVSHAASASEITILMVGDDLIHQAVYEQCRQKDGSYNFDKIFANVKEDIESADIAIINQETIFVHNEKNASSYPCFGTPETIGHSIVSSGFDVVAHATNHTMDKGVYGIMDTIDFWETNYPGFSYLGIHEKEEGSDIRYLTKNGIKVGFVNYTYGLNGLESRRKGKEYLVDMLSDPDIENTMKEAKENCDLLIAILHVGDEYVYTPSKYAKQQVDRFIDLGADIVLCAHPHVLEPYAMATTESGNTALVYYSLGNFVSSQAEVPRVLGGMADIKVRKEKDEIKILSYDLIPLVTHQSPGNYTTYRLDEYPDALAAQHRLMHKGFSKEALNELFRKITKNES